MKTHRIVNQPEASQPSDDSTPRESLIVNLINIHRSFDTDHVLVWNLWLELKESF